MQNPYNTRIKIKKLNIRDQTVFSHPMNNKKERSLSAKYIPYCFNYLFNQIKLDIISPGMNLM